MNDYPAAHSMDTTWFAVDEDGHVAMFDTGENGHAPAGFTSGSWDVTSNSRTESMDWYLIRQLAAANPERPLRPLSDLLELAEQKGDKTWATSSEGGVRITVPLSPDEISQEEGLLARLFGGISWKTEQVPDWPSYDIFLRVTSLEKVRKEIDNRIAVPFIYTYGEFAYFQTLPLNTIQRLAEQDGCTGWFQIQSPEKELRSIGLYVYNYEYSGLAETHLLGELVDLFPYACIEPPDVRDWPLHPPQELLATAIESGGTQEWSWKGKPPNVCLRVRTTEAVRLEIARHLAEPLSYPDAQYVYFHELPIETARRLIAQHVCTGWFPVDVDGSGANLIWSVRDRGKPDYPVHIDKLPPEVQPQLRQICFASCSFAEMPVVQPLDSLPMAMDCWYRLACSYLAADLHTVRPIRGKEAVYRDRYPELLELAKKYQKPLFLQPPQQNSL